MLETKEQIAWRKAAKYRLRALIRKVRLNAFWLSELEDVTLGQNVLKNITIILNRSREKRGVLTIHEKAMLRKAPQSRTREEIAHLSKMFDVLPCFKPFSPIVREKLINVVEFQYFEKDRLLLKEGHLAHSCYFILTGEVVISKLVTDREGSVASQPMNILSSGDSFGQVGLICNTPRNASVSTKSKWVNIKLVEQFPALCSSIFQKLSPALIY
jgi:Cyclic nucleotide-binding domain